MIRITRDEDFNILRSYKIYIDDVYRGKIRINQTKEFPVENGKHTIRAKIDWGGSNKLCVDVNDSIVDLKVGCPLGEGELFSFVSYLTILRDEYLYLKEKGDDELQEDEAE